MQKKHILYIVLCYLLAAFLAVFCTAQTTIPAIPLELHGDDFKVRHFTDDHQTAYTIRQTQPQTAYRLYIYKGGIRYSYDAIVSVIHTCPERRIIAWFYNVNGVLRSVIITDFAAVEVVQIY